MAKIVYRQMPTPLELPQKIPTPLCKSWDAKAPGWEEIFGANPRGYVGGMVMDEIVTCISLTFKREFRIGQLMFGDKN